MNAQAGQGARGAFAEQEEAHETLEIVYEISQLLNCGIDKKTLSILISLCENGVNPEALALVVKEIKAEAEARNVNTCHYPRITRGPPEPKWLMNALLTKQHSAQIA